MQRAARGQAAPPLAPAAGQPSCARLCGPEREGVASHWGASPCLHRQPCLCRNPPASTRPAGDILMFLTGQAEIDKATKQLNDAGWLGGAMARRSAEGWHASALHAAGGAAQQAGRGRGLTHLPRPARPPPRSAESAARAVRRPSGAAHLCSAAARDAGACLVAQQAQQACSVPCEWLSARPGRRVPPAHAPAARPRVRRRVCLRPRRLACGAASWPPTLRRRL